MLTRLIVTLMAILCPVLATAQQPALPKLPVIALLSNDLGLFDGKPFRPREIALTLIARQPSPIQPPIINVVACAKVSHETVQGVLREIERAKIWPILDLATYQSAACVK